MTTPVFVLILFAAWTVLMVLLVGFHRWKCVLTGTVPKEGFPSDVVPADGWYRRVLQAHRNCVENLGIYIAIVVVLTALGLDNPLLDKLAIAVISARAAQSLVHIALEQTRPVVMVRFSFFLIQIIAFIGMITISLGV